jgi:autotransporter-associated beta strand protein
MPSPRLLFRFAAPFVFLLALALIPRAALAQTISEGVQTYASLSGATVTLGGKSELRLTSSTPLSGSTVNLTSPDAWVLFTSVKPSVVVSTYLSQLRVNGAAAVSGTNVRVVQHELGAIVIPHSSSFQPLQAFTGPDFTGTSASYSQYTYYNSAASLGSLNRAISSFKLKRGYMATFSTQTNGSGPSRVYIAQDGDLEIGRLPAELDNAIRFVRVLPWRWVSKKGSCDVSASTLDSSWFYNWNNDQNSPLDWEYVPIRQQRWWPGYPTNKPDSTHLLGFNEPDNPVEDAYTSLNNGDVDTAIAVWPELLATGLRVGSPAVTDGGVDWLYDFIDKADAADLRVDYVAIHFYRCGYTATQLYNWLYDIHARTGRPIWVTEFNNGANWTSCADPTYEQNATRIAEFTEMMDNAPFIERYAVYSAVEYMRQMTYDTGGLTPAGVAYKANASPISYAQRIPKTGSRGVAQFAFDGDTLDNSGFGNNATGVGRPAYTTGLRGSALRLDGANTVVQLPPDLATSTSFTFAAWVYWDGGGNWQRIFDFGRGTSNYMFLTPSSGSGTLRFAIRNGGSEQVVQTASALPVGQWSHIALTLAGGTARLYLNGVQAASGAISITPAQLAADLNFLGKSQFAADPLFAGRLDEVRIADYAFSAAQIAALPANTAPQFPSASINGGNATQGQPYSASVAGTATDADAGDTLVYSKSAGPAWLVVSSGGALSGTPTFSDEGAQEFVITVTDAAGATDSVVFTVTLPSVLGNGTWNTDASGTWSDTTKWTSSFPANGAGYAADFSTLNISADRAVTLNTSRSIGTLRFGDTSGAQNWTLASSGGSTLTLDTGAGTAPTIAVNQTTATISAPLAGANGLNKSGSGILVLAASNSLSGTVNIDTGNSSINEGAVRLAHPNALASATTLAIRNNNGGSSTLLLDGTLGDVLVPAAINLSARTSSIAAIRNLAGSNTLSGAIALQSGGGNYFFHSDAGTLTLGAISTALTGDRTLTFSGAGNTTLGGLVSNGSATIHLAKSGTGRLLLSAANTFTGNVTVSGGTLAILGTGALYAGGWNNAAILTVNSGSVLELDRWGYGPNGTYRTQALGGLDYNPARLVINGGTVRFTGGAAGAPQNPSEAPYGPGFTIGASGATLDAAKADDTWMVRNDSRGTGPVASAAGGALTLTGVGNGVFDKVLPGTGALVKNGTGIWTLTQANTSTGAISVAAGTLLVTGSTSTGQVTVGASGALGGTGTLGGALLVQGALSPGPASGIGRLTTQSSATLAAGSLSRFEINKSAATRDQLFSSGALTLGGTLSVTNLAGTLAVGDSFTLFQAGSIGGSFDAYDLPVLAEGLRWKTSTLAQGVLAIEYDPAAYAGWLGTRSIPSDSQGETQDPDGDGLANALEWLFGTDPLAADASGAQPTLALREFGPAEWPAAVEGERYLSLTATVRKNLVGATVFAQASTSLDTLDGAESSASTTSFVVSDLGDFEQRTWIYTQPIGQVGGRAFMRLKVTFP